VKCPRNDVEKKQEGTEKFGVVVRVFPTGFDSSNPSATLSRNIKNISKLTLIKKGNGCFTPWMWQLHMKTHQ
jgi:hypothetical protein